MLGVSPTRAYRPGTPGATTFLSPLSGTFNYGWDSFLKPDPDERYQEVLKLINDLGKVDEWLDWQYEHAGALERWSTRSENHEKVIELTRVSGEVYEIRAKTIRAEDGHQRNSQMFSGNADTRARAHVIVRDALTNL